ncbi:MAG: nitroreductase family protein, partial [Bacillota bacterium]|nr:nitroreductase family protein [Bacillota bacterium]
MVKVDKEKCIGCGLCKNDCLMNDLVITDGKCEPVNKTCIHCGHCIAVCPVNAVSPVGGGEDEITVMKPEDYAVDSEKLMNLLRFRRTIRKYKNTPIDRDDFSKVIEAGRISPTGTNSQEIRFVVFEKELKKLKEMALTSLSELADDIMADPESPKTMKIYSRMWKRMNQEYFEEGKDRLFYDAPAVVAVVADTKYNKLTPPLDGAIACANMEIMARTLGLGTCYIGF